MALRVGSLIFNHIGQLLPHQLRQFSTKDFIFPVSNMSRLGCYFIETRKCVEGGEMPENLHLIWILFDLVSCHFVSSGGTEMPNSCVGFLFLICFLFLSFSSCLER